MANQLSVISRIQHALPNMSEAKRNVGRYLLENWQEAAFLSASKLARNVGVSESVIVRFSQDLDYSGFPELQGALQTILKNRLTGISNSNVGENPEPSRTMKHSSDSIQKVFDITLKNLQSTLHANQQDTFLRAIDYIQKANRIVVIGSRNAGGPAKVLAVHLNEIFTNAMFLEANHDEVFDHLRGLTPKDLVIAIGLPSYSNFTIRATEFVASRGVPQITITESLLSPLVHSNGVVLLTNCNSYSYASSHVSTLFLIDVLIHLLTVNDKGKVLTSLEEVKDINERYQFYQT